MRKKRRRLNVDLNDIRRIEGYLAKPIKEGDLVTPYAISKINGMVNLGLFEVVKVHKDEWVDSGAGTKVLCELEAVYEVM